jgi:hypothetical protein
MNRPALLSKIVFPENLQKRAMKHLKKHAWRLLLTLLILISIVLLSQLPLLAAPDAPGKRPTSAALQLYTAGVQMAPAIPTLLGVDEPQTYLILVQNNHELRATGGFITAVGTITVDKGRLSGLEFTDSYVIAPDTEDHPLAPEPMKQFMGIEILFLRDANWSPDFPTSARFAQALYAQDVGVEVDGVVAVDLRSVELLVGALAPLEVPGADTPLTGDNILEQIMNFWDQPPGTDISPEAGHEWWLQRKDFMPLVAKAAIERIQSGDFNPISLAEAIHSALNERAVQIWLADPEAAELLAEQGWDGRMLPEEGADYLSLIDMNMGYNKVNAVLERELDYKVDWPDDPAAPAQATLTVTYRHPLNVVDERCSPQTGYGMLVTYTEMIERCYFGYVRLYVPKGSELLSLDGVEANSVHSQAGERGTRVFAGYFSMKPGQEHTVTFTYHLPPSITPEDYRLVVQRQAGIGPLPLEIAIGDTAFNTTLADGRMVWPSSVGIAANP